MRDRNNCNPQLGQRRLAIGGNWDGSKRFGCGITHSLTDTGGSAIGLVLGGDLSIGKKSGSLESLCQARSAADRKRRRVFSRTQ
jgi:hypothetical protein